MKRFLPRRLGLVFALSFAALALVVPAASAHPLGNFTINHYSGIRVEPSAVIVDHVTDYAEIPTFSERRAMDTNGDGDVSSCGSRRFRKLRPAQALAASSICRRTAARSR